MVSELIRNIETKVETTQTQKLAALINSGMCREQFDLVSFCETRGLDLTNLWKVSRLYQIGETALVDFWNYCLQNNPGLLETVKDPDKLYQNIITAQSLSSNGNLNFLEMVNFNTDEVNKLERNMTSIMAGSINENKKLVKANIEYLTELGVKNVQEIFAEYYELFLMDHSNFTGIFNKYDPEDLIEKLVKNIAIVEYL